MATLENINGRSLVADITPSLNLLLEARDKARQRDSNIQDGNEIGRQLDIIGTPGVSDDAVTNSLLQIGRIDSKFAKFAGDIIKSGNQQQIDALEKESETAAKRAVLLRSLKTRSEKINMLGQFAQQDILDNKNPQQFLDMMDLSPDMLELELQKDEFMGRELENIFKKVDAPAKETFFPTFNKEGERTGQESSTTGKRIADPTIPRQAVGKATVIDPGKLTADGFLLEQLPGGGVRKTKVLSPEQVSRLSKAGNTATGETRIMDDGTVIFANKDSTVSVVDQAGRNIPEGPERTKVLKAALKAKGDLARIQSGQKAAGTQAITASGKAFEKVAVIRANILNLDRAVEAIDGGAKTGAIISRFPSIRTASVKLDQIQRELGLDVIGDTTFGALSQGELDLALATAIPTRLSPEELKKWLIGKKQAQIKLMGYIERSALFLGEPGNTLKDWKEKQIADQMQKETNAVGTKVGDKVGKFIIKGIR